jgi:hypothetical protein
MAGGGAQLRAFASQSLPVLQKDLHAAPAELLAAVTVRLASRVETLGLSWRGFRRHDATLGNARVPRPVALCGFATGAPIASFDGATQWLNSSST